MFKTCALVFLAVTGLVGCLDAPVDEESETEQSSEVYAPPTCESVCTTEADATACVDETGTETTCGAKRNPRTGNTILIPERTTITVKR